MTVPGTEQRGLRLLSARVGADDAMRLGSLLTDLLGPDVPVRFLAYDGTDVGPRDAAATVTVHSPRALNRLALARGELGLARAYVAGDITIEGDIYEVLALRKRFDASAITPTVALRMARIAGIGNLRPLPPPPQEHRARGRRHSRSRDADAISHHYDVSNRFYRMVLGPSLTYSCAVFASPTDTLEAAQANKYDLVCTKLGLGPGMRLLDIGCGWGGMVLHAAQHYGVDAVGVTISQEQAELAKQRVADAGLGHRVEIRVQDYRDVDDPHYDAISSIGMFEHVGMEGLAVYFEDARDLLTPEGRMLNHAISRTTTVQRPRTDPRGFINRYVFPDGELHEVGTVISTMQDTGFEVRHMESLREHYALTLRRWVSNLDTHWEEAVAEAGIGNARIWRLYMAGSAVMFEDHKIGVDQVLAANTGDDGDSGFPLPSDRTW
jgi:cyclopropane-fatty-acyl-phospholipid synthase